MHSFSTKADQTHLKQPSIAVRRHTAERPLRHELAGGAVEHLLDGREALRAHRAHAGPVGWVVVGPRVSGRAVAWKENEREIGVIFFPAILRFLY